MCMPKKPNPICHGRGSRANARACACVRTWTQVRCSAFLSPPSVPQAKSTRLHYSRFPAVQNKATNHTRSPDGAYSTIRYGNHRFEWPYFPPPNLSGNNAEPTRVSTKTQNKRASRDTCSTDSNSAGIPSILFLTRSFKTRNTTVPALSSHSALQLRLCGRLALLYLGVDAILGLRLELEHGRRAGEVAVGVHLDRVLRRLAVPVRRAGLSCFFQRWRRRGGRVGVRIRGQRQREGYGDCLV